ncbi:nitroreductase family deazaflavin-dependent oxidoreductase [Isoptericola sp. AK164]|uniref:nitroreductase family deazaflavin-dependent oxidoreductase n=1 Tax=Isoptericola sp. AK164 TaxID=3024246 RepID=UPI0024189DEB|nr:nitroreductase family deazaflavin-dependent oxidoreductase [Isoptericola sp. AK164]
MWHWIAGLVGGLLALALAAVVGLVVSMRTKWQPGLRLVRRLNKRFTNPRVLATAGRPGGSAAVIRHVGRRSGRSYATPIGVEVGDGVLVTLLPYGPTTDWVRNVLAAGGAQVTVQGRTSEVTDPRVVPVAEASALLPAGERRLAAVFGATEVLLLTPAV